MTAAADDGPRLAAPHPQQGGRAASWPNRFQGCKLIPSKIVIVRDMWLHGFGCPCPAHHVSTSRCRARACMQAMRHDVNRVFRDKPGGLVVDLSSASRSAQAGPWPPYTESGGKGEPAHLDTAAAIAVNARKTRHRLGISCTGFAGRPGPSGHPHRAPAPPSPAGQEHICFQEETASSAGCKVGGCRTLPRLRLCSASRRTAARSATNREFLLSGRCRLPSPSKPAPPADHLSRSSRHTASW